MALEAIAVLNDGTGVISDPPIQKPTPVNALNILSLSTEELEDLVNGSRSSSGNTSGTVYVEDIYFGSNQSYFPSNVPLISFLDYVQNKIVSGSSSSQINEDTIRNIVLNVISECFSYSNGELYINIPEPAQQSM